MKNTLNSYAEIFQSVGINDGAIVYGKNYDSEGKLFRNRYLSETEVVGFFTGLGFRLIKCEEIKFNMYYHFQREEVIPVKCEKRSVFVKLERVGLHGKRIFVYKFRTMHPYAQYLQRDLINEFGYNEVGKLKNDNRITRLGKFLRKYYLDEIPQFINWLRGDIRLVGCRPVSSLFLESYPKEVLQMRLQFKPGIISPAIADGARTVKEVIDSEYKFLLNISQEPWKTRFRVFIKSITNVLFRKIKSE